MCWSIVRRAFALGLVCGSCVGAVVGTFALPLVGTLFGAVIGGDVGTLLGLLNAPILIVVAGSTRTTWSARKTWATRIAAAATSGAAAWWLVVGADLWRLPGAVLILVCVLVGGFAGPLAVGERDRSGVITTRLRGAAFDGCVGGACVGGVLGAVSGLALGLLSNASAPWSAGLVAASILVPGCGWVGALAGAADGRRNRAGHAGRRLVT